MANNSICVISDNNVGISDRFSKNSLSKVTFRKKPTTIKPLVNLTASGRRVIEDAVHIEKHKNPSEQLITDKYTSDLSTSVYDHLCTNDKTSKYYHSKDNCFEVSLEHKKMESIPESIETKLNRSINKLSYEVDMMDSEELITNKHKIKGKKKKRKSKEKVTFDFKDECDSGAVADSANSVERQRKKEINNKESQKGSVEFVAELNSYGDRSNMEPLEEHSLVGKNCDTLDNYNQNNNKEEIVVETPVIENISFREKKKKKKKLTKDNLFNFAKGKLLQSNASAENEIEEISSTCISESPKHLKQKRPKINHPEHEEEYSITIEGESLKSYNNCNEVNQDAEIGTVRYLHDKKSKNKHKRKHYSNLNSPQINEEYHCKSETPNHLKQKRPKIYHPEHEEEYSNTIEGESLKRYNNCNEVNQDTEIGTVRHLHDKKSKNKPKRKHNSHLNSPQINEEYNCKSESPNRLKQKRPKINHPEHEEEYYNTVESGSQKSNNNCNEVNHDAEIATVKHLYDKQSKNKHKRKHHSDLNSSQINKEYNYKRKRSSFFESQESSKSQHISVIENYELDELYNKVDRRVKFIDNLNTVNNMENNNSFNHFTVSGPVDIGNTNSISDQSISRKIVNFRLQNECLVPTGMDPYNKNKHKNNSVKKGPATKSSANIASIEEKHIEKKSSEEDGQLNLTRADIVKTDENNSKTSNINHKNKSHKKINIDIDEMRNKLMKNALKNIHKHKTKRCKPSSPKNIDMKVKRVDSLDLNSKNKPNNPIKEKKIHHHNIKQKKKKKSNKIDDLTDMLISKVLKERGNDSNTCAPNIETKRTMDDCTNSSVKPEKIAEQSYTSDKCGVGLKKKKSKSLLHAKTDIKKIQQSLIDKALKELNSTMEDAKKKKTKTLKNPSGKHIFHKKGEKTKKGKQNVN